MKKLRLFLYTLLELLYDLYSVHAVASKNWKPYQIKKVQDMIINRNWILIPKQCWI